MNIFLKFSIIVCLLFAIGYVVANKNHSSCGEDCANGTLAVKEGCDSCGGCPSGGCDKEMSINKSSDTLVVTGENTSQAASEVKLPKLIDFGKSECIPCKMMEPVLESLKENYSDMLQVEFINTELDPEAVKEYGITGIPTQIFFDAEGNELYRNLGYIPEEKILIKWKELGIEL